MMWFSTISVFLIVNTTLYSVLCGETTSSYANAFFKEIADIICKPEMSDEMIGSIKANCNSKFEETSNESQWLSCTGKTALTDRQRFDAFCNATVANCADDLYKKVTPGPGTTPKSAEDFEKFQKEYIACLKKITGKA